MIIFMGLNVTLVILYHHPFFAIFALSNSTAMRLVCSVLSETCCTMFEDCADSLVFMRLETIWTKEQPMTVCTQYIPPLVWFLVGTGVAPARLTHAPLTGVVGRIICVEDSVTIVTEIGSIEESCQRPAPVIVALRLDQDEDVVLIRF